MLKQAFIDIITLKAVVIAASKEKTRYYLGGVYVEITDSGTTYVATDGHILAARLLAHQGKPSDNTLRGNFIIPYSVIKLLKINPRFNPRFNPHFEPLQTEDMKVFKLAGQIFEMIDGTYPDWRRIIPRTVDGVRDGVLINPALLVKSGEIGKTLGIGQFPNVLYNGTGPAICHYDMDSDSSVVVVVMPMRNVTKTPAKLLPDWLVGDDNPKSANKAA